MGRPPIGKVAMSGAERTRLYRLKHGTAEPVTKHVTKPAGHVHDALVRELAAARARIAELEAKLQQLTEQDDSEVAVLKAELERARELYWQVRAALDDAIGKRLGTPEQHKLLCAAVHPDRVADPKLKRKYEDLFKIVTDLGGLFKHRPKPAPSGKMPNTAEEWAAARQRAREANRAKAKRAAATKAAKAGKGPRALPR
jgi:hypothetical protein